jgi:hypothetical protein
MGCEGQRSRLSGIFNRLRLEKGYCTVLCLPRGRP